MSDKYYECSECGAVNLGDGACPMCKAASELAPARLLAAKREAAFYRKTLMQICDDTRNTRAKRLAISALTFWDQTQKAKTQNGGVICDTAKGPCACGAWHSAANEKLTHGPNNQNV